MKIIAIFILGIIIGYQTDEFTSSWPRWNSDSLYIHQLNHHSCVHPTNEEEKLYELSVQVLEFSDKVDTSYLRIGSQKFLSHGIYRRKGKNIEAVCAPDGTYQRVSDAITKYEQFRYRIQEYQLKLASKIKSPSAYIVEVVADVAFSPVYHIGNNKDLRPLARSILASFGRKAKKYGEAAYHQMSESDPLGTGAAQIASAAGYKDTLPRIQVLMNKILSTSKPINNSKRNRFYELAYALYISKESTIDYSDPIKEFMRRDFVQFTLPPQEMCRVLISIHGGDHTVVKEYEYCKD